ncbi:MAG: hypothetical protein QF741_02345 [Candidatus Peribacteraceae bacterium]|jgi:transporter family protein|nr:hypothetical protein [Candidatus Peribacteraceae bacterium]MDP7454496.1 hypothetical protein [Candidatus Peribacteraceae bacterium]
MTPQTIGLIIGGLVPALLYGFSGMFAKASNEAGISVGIYLLIIGISIAALGGISAIFDTNHTLNMKSGMHALGFGITWGIASGLIAIALTKYHSPISQLAPLYNLNTLVTIVLALWIFSEWNQVKVPQLLFGSLLIVVGGIFVARA